MYSTAKRSVSTLLSFLLAPLPELLPCGAKAAAMLAGMCCRRVAKPLFTCFTLLRSLALRRATEAGCWGGVP